MFSGLGISSCMQKGCQSNTADIGGISIYVHLKHDNIKQLRFICYYIGPGQDIQLKESSGQTSFNLTLQMTILRTFLSYRVESCQKCAQLALSTLKN